MDPTTITTKRGAVDSNPWFTFEGANAHGDPVLTYRAHTPHLNPAFQDSHRRKPLWFDEGEKWAHKLIDKDKYMRPEGRFMSHGLGYTFGYGVKPFIDRLAQPSYEYVRDFSKAKSLPKLQHLRKPFNGARKVGNAPQLYPNSKKLNADKSRQTQRGTGWPRQPSPRGPQTQATTAQTRTRRLPRRRRRKNGRR